MPKITVDQFVMQSKLCNV